MSQFDLIHRKRIREIGYVSIIVILILIGIVLKLTEDLIKLLTS